MNILSITFHVEQNIIPIWENILVNEVLELVKNINQKNKHILSKIANNYQTEGENYNIILIFKDRMARNTFEFDELPKLNKIIQDRFQNQEVIIFVTNLDVISRDF